MRLFKNTLLTAGATGILLASSAFAETGGTKVIVEEQSPQITVDQPPAQVSVDQREPQVDVQTQAPQVSVDQSEPQVSVEQPEPQVEVEQAQPDVRVSDAEPQVDVHESDAQVRVEEPQQESQARIEERQHRMEGAPGAVAANPQQQAQPEPSSLYEMPVEELRSARVVDENGMEIGQVENVVLKSDGSEAGLIISLSNSQERESGSAFANLDELSFEEDTLVWEDAADAAFLDEDEDYDPAEYQAAPTTAGRLSDIMRDDEVSAL